MVGAPEMIPTEHRAIKAFSTHAPGVIHSFWWRKLCNHGLLENGTWRF